MSKQLVIKNGFKLTDVDGLDGVNEFILENQPKFEELAMNVWAEMIAIDVAKLYDLDCYNSVTTKTNYIADAYASAEHDLYASFQKNVSTPLDLEVQLFFQTSDKGDGVYGMYFITNTILIKQFHDLDGVEPFNYVQGEDTDEDKKVIWDSILKNTGNPTTSMFSYNLIKAGPINVTVKNILNKLPEKIHRVNNLANHIVISEFEKTNTHEFTSNEEVWAYFQGTEHVTKVQAKVTELMDILEDSIRKPISKLSK